MFRGQITPKVKRTLESLNIEMVLVPDNMTHFFQPLDLTVNGSAKNFMKKAFITYYSNEVQAQLKSGKELESVEVDLRLTAIKPLHAQWLVNLYNFFTTTEGRSIVVKGWKKAESLVLWTVSQSSKRKTLSKTYLQISFDKPSQMPNCGTM